MPEISLPGRKVGRVAGGLALRVYIYGAGHCWYSAPLQTWPPYQVGRELSSLCSFTSQHGLLQGPGLGLGPEVTEQMVPNGAQDVWYVPGQARALNFLDSRPEMLKGEGWGRTCLDVKKHEPPPHFSSLAGVAPVHLQPRTRPLKF